MKTLTKRTVAILVVLVLAGAGSAFAQTSVWCQETDFADALPSYSDIGTNEVIAITADDFLSNTDSAITGITWTGAKYSTSHDIDHFIITVYSKDPSCNAPDDANIISQQYRYGFSETPGFAIFYDYETSLDPVLMNAGDNYWVSIVGVPDSSGVQWFWATSGTPDLCDGLSKSAEFGWVDWQHVGTPAFCLTTDGTVATETQSMGGIKSLFR